MSLLNKVANREVFDFLRTLTIKSTYFADKSRAAQILPRYADLVPGTAVPYIIHLAGEYILNNDDKESFPEEQILGVPWFKGYRRTRDSVVRPFKNYWECVGNRALRRMNPQEMEFITNPASKNLYEIQPYVVKGITNPVTGVKEDYEIRSSQMIYGGSSTFGGMADGQFAGHLNFEVKNSELFLDCFDEMMTVISLDTGEEIPFCLEAFYADSALAAGLSQNAIHVKTLEAYRIPGRYFDALCERYPKQVDLIKAIVYRVPDEDLFRLKQVASLVTEPELQAHLQKTIQMGLPTDRETYQRYLRDLKRRYPKQIPLLNLMGADINGSRSSEDGSMPLWERRRTRISKARNFDLLAYDDARLDSTERVSLREYVCQTLNVFRDRWAVDEYNFEENYATVLWSCLWSVLPMACIAKRYANIKTPHVSLSHMWDYLNSKGLASYRGYLTDKQTWFLYKNIQFLFQHQGQQKALDILVDNILADFGLTLKSRTVVLDTTDSLTLDEKPKVAKIQCETCARRGVSCFRNDKEHLCDEWLGTKHLCKAEPITLTENFVGATRGQILRLLVKNYGYTEEAAEAKYRRSFIWRDEDVEKIRDDLNRDQMVDMSGHTESLAETLTIEHSGGQEPVVNDDILEEQTKQLQHMHGTYAPTKLLEMSQKTYNVKFTELFNRFITETFLRFATPMPNGLKRTRCRYMFDTSENSATYIFDFNEMMAACYLGFVKEFNIDTILDTIKKNTDGSPRYDFVTNESGNKIVIDVNPITGEPIYLKYLFNWERRWLTDMVNSPTYDFPIPDKCRTTTALKFGQPVLQDELYQSWLAEDEKTDLSEIQRRLLEVAGKTSEDGRILQIRDIYYFVSKRAVDKDNSDDIWTGFPFGLEIEGSFTHELVGEGTKWSYLPNDDEIPVIPKFFKWYNTHLNPSLTATEEERKMMEQDARLAMNPEVTDKAVEYVPNETCADPENALMHSRTQKIESQTDKVYYDKNRGQIYRVFHMSQFLDVESLIERWVDMRDMITDQNQIANYIDRMFPILEDIYNFASASGSVRTHLACSYFLDAVIAKKEISFELTSTPKQHDTTEGGLCAWYSDWLTSNQELSGSFRILDHLKDSVTGWNEFNTAIVNKLLEGCTIQYAKEAITRTQYQKLKELVMSLSSYRITIIDNVETGQVCNSTVAMVEDDIVEAILTTEHIYFDPIGDAIPGPRVGGYEQTDENGFILVPTGDIHFDPSKTYYKLTVKDSEAYDSQDEHQLLHLKARPLAHVEPGLPEGSILDVGCEAIDIPVSEVFEPYVQTQDKFILKDKVYYKENPVSKKYVKTGTSDYDWIKVMDVTVEIPDDALHGIDDQGNDIVYTTVDICEALQPGDLLPVGRCFEKVNLYTILGLEANTPILVSKIGTKWFYSTGQIELTTVCAPASAADKTDPRFDEVWFKSGDRFDLKNDFSNDYTKQFFDSIVYRVNVPVQNVKWAEPIESYSLGKVLFPSIMREFVLVTSTEPTMELVEIVKEEEKES